MKNSFSVASDVARRIPTELLSVLVPAETSIDELYEAKK